MGMSGEAADRLQFGDFMQKNIHLKKYKTGIKLTTKETAHFIRFHISDNSYDLMNDIELKWLQH